MIELSDQEGAANSWIVSVGFSTGLHNVDGIGGFSGGACEDKIQDFYNSAPCQER